MSISELRIEYLADHPAYVPQLAEYHLREWGHLHPAESIEGRTNRIRAVCGRGTVPTTVVALIGDELAGSAMLIAHDMDTHPELTPWLAGVFVTPGQRLKGLGSLLVERIVTLASNIGSRRLYLYTEKAQAFYSRLGWHHLERCKYLGAEVAVMGLDLHP